MGNQPSRPGEKPSPSHSHSPSNYSHPSRHQHRKHAYSASSASATTGTASAANASRSPAHRPTSGTVSASASAAGSPHNNYYNNNDNPLVLTSQVPRYHPSVMGQSQSNESGAGAKDESRAKRKQQQQQQSWDEEGSRSSPVQVPVGGAHINSNQRSDGQHTDATEEEIARKSNLNFPPRLPLPIQEEVYTPGSPIISPDDLSQALREDSDVQLPHRTSLLSHTTAEDEEEAGEYEAAIDKKRTVPTLIRWTGVAEKVYVTGSFANWSRKFRMHRDPNNPQLLITRLDLQPGTHHVKFIVDGDMKLSDDLPTAVDYTNILVNYIEVSADDIPKGPSAEQKAQEKPPGIHPPLVLPPGIEHTDWQPKPEEEKPLHHQQQPDKKYLPHLAAHYSNSIPQYLPDLDKDEGSNRFRRSMAHITDIPPPPSLPLFLGKSILNGTTPMKDDNSVLNMPNHTVLNHLATSSIKNNVLATSLTTRYKRKYITTITYRPTHEDD